jgi:hypothetical protein
MAGTKELKELVGFGLSCAELIAGLAEGVSFDDVTKLVAVARQAGPGLNGAGAALVEYVKMSDAEAADLEAFVESEFDIPADTVELAIEGALKVAIQLRELVGLVLPKAA